MKRALIITGIVFGVLLVIVLGVPFVVPVGQLKPTFEQEASAVLGRKVQIGNLRLSVWEGSLGVDDLSVADDPNFSTAPFLTAESVKVGVKILPLIFSRALDITEITIERPQIILIRGANAQWNYSTLAEAQTAQGQSAAPNSPAGGQTQVSVRKLELKNGQVSVGSTGSDKVNVYDHVNVTTSNVSLTSQFPVKLTASLPNGGTVMLNGKVGPVDPHDTVLTPLNANMTVHSLDLTASGILDPAEGLSGVLDFQANVNSQNGQSVLKGSATITNALLVAGGSASPVPIMVDFTTEYNLQQNAGTLDASTLSVGNAQAQVSGTYEIPPGGASVNLTVDGQNMPTKDLQAFLPAVGIFLPKGATLEAGTLSGSLNLTGPTDKLVTTGNVGLYDAKMLGFDLGSKMSTVSSFLGVKTGKDLEIQKVTSQVEVSPDGIKATNFMAVLPLVGTLSGGGTIDAKNNMNFVMQAKLSITTKGILGSDCKDGLAVDFQIHGTTSDPKFTPSVNGTAKQLAKGQTGCAKAAVKTAVAQKTNSFMGKLGGLFKKKQQ